MADPGVVLDASAVLALLHREPGHDKVEEALDDAVVSAVNLAEVATRLHDAGLDAAAVRVVLERLDVQVVPFDEVQALGAAALRPRTRAAGLALGDRACLALAGSTGRTALTADRAWTRLDLEVRITTIR